MAKRKKHLKKVNPRIAKQYPKYLPMLAVGLAAVLVFANALGNGLVYDDRFLILRNRLVLEQDWWGVLTTHYWGGYEGNETGQYRPLTVLTFVLDGLGGISPFRFHLTNVLLHGLNSALVYALCRRVGLQVWGAGFAALLFAVHPVHAEVAAGVTFGRADLLAALGVLGTLLFYARWHAGEGERFYGFALGAFFLGLLSKESALTAVGAIAAFDLAFARASLRQRLPRWAGFVGAFAVYVLMRRVAAGLGFEADSLSALNNPLVDFGWDVRLYTAAALFWKYLAMIVWPAQLSVDYSFNAIPAVSSLLNVQTLAGGIAGLGGLALWIMALRKWPLAFFLGAVFWAPYSAVSQTAVLINAMFQERFLYLPVLGIFALAGLGFERLLLRQRDLVLALSVLLILGYAWRTVERNRDWRDDLTLYQSAVRAYPGSAKMQHALGDALSERGRFAEAEAAYRQALSIREDALTYNNLGNVAVATERWQAAEAAYQQALALGPDDVGAWVNLGLARLRAGRADGAAEAFEKATVLNPGDADIQYNLGAARSASGSHVAAAQAYQRAVALRPDWAEAHFNLGNALRDSGDAAGAVGAYQRFLSLWRGNPAVADLARQEIERLGR